MMQGDPFPIAIYESWQAVEDLVVRLHQSELMRRVIKAPRESREVAIAAVSGWLESRFLELEANDLPECGQPFIRRPCGLSPR
jgi:hypothetical protein